MSKTGWLAGLISIFLITATANAKERIFGVVSDRSAAELASGAALFLTQQPNFSIALRTPTQFSGMSDADIVKEIKSADAVFSGAVFGDQVSRLMRLVKQAGKQRPFLGINSDHRLVRLSQDQKGMLFSGVSSSDIRELAKGPREAESYLAWHERRRTANPRQATWIDAKSYWQARGRNNLASFFAVIARAIKPGVAPGKLVPRADVRTWFDGRMVENPGKLLPVKKPWIAIIDHDTGDRSGDIDTTEQLCKKANDAALNCVAFFARWGAASGEALLMIEKLAKTSPLQGVVSLQDFVIGGGDARATALETIERLDVPVIKGIRLTEVTEDAWAFSTDGLPWKSVHYRVSMPELQGVSQPIVMAAATPVNIDPVTGVRLVSTMPIDEQISLAIDRLAAWQRLGATPNKDKKVAIVYYNHPPGRHNIGADNLDVPASLFEILNRLKAAGYNTGLLPKSSKDLLDLIQDRGVNLPEDRAAIADMSNRVVRVSTPEYRSWFEKLPKILQAEMAGGPLSFLAARVSDALEKQQLQAARKLIDRITADVRHVLDGADHPAKKRAINLLEQLNTAYDVWHENPALPSAKQKAMKLTRALIKTGIEGLRGWGEAPGEIMTYKGDILLPGITFGNVFIGPQPPRGWELNEELLHANMSFPPPHQYMAFYFWLKYAHKADAIVHLGRHSTYEFLPRRSVGVGPADYSWHIASTIPGIYPYIVDGVGEGIQAKRRGLEVMIDHLTPPLSATPLYDELLELRQLIETYEAANGEGQSSVRTRSLDAMRLKIDALNLKEELSASMDAELKIRGITFDQADGEFLVHEVGHYLTKLQEDFMPLGLHVFGRDWSDKAVNVMLDSMLQGDQKKSGESDLWRANLKKSPAAEIKSLLQALEGKFVSPGKGNDPIRTPESLPTGRNFFALDGSVLPTRLGHALGVELATKSDTGSRNTEDGREAIILWASDTVRDEGAMIAFGLQLLGVEPQWNSRGIVRGVKRMALKDEQVRKDTVFITSGLFRDLYGQQLALLDNAVLLALDGASQTIRNTYPKLGPALDAALDPLGTSVSNGGENLTQNEVAAHWVKDALAELQAGVDAAKAGRQAGMRIFGTAPGSYGAGVNRLVERSGAWEDRKELGAAYIKRMGHAYGMNRQGVASQETFKRNLARVENTYLGRGSNLYGFIDNNDAFDYLGGLSLAVETLTGSAPNNRVIHHADPNNASMEPLTSALLAELRGRFLNPEWLKPLMKHDYAGARTMGSEFMEYLWGWQVTNPDIITSRVWDDVKDVYLDDKYGLGLDEFLESGQNIHVKTNMMAIMLVSAQKGFWTPDEKTLDDLSKEFVEKILENGLPGSGHTTPDHPMFKWITPRLDVATAKALEELLDSARLPMPEVTPTITTVQEVEVTEIEPQPREPEEPKSRNPEQGDPEEVLEADIPDYGIWLLLLMSGVLVFGVVNGRRSIRRGGIK